MRVFLQSVDNYLTRRGSVGGRAFFFSAQIIICRQASNRKRKRLFVVVVATGKMVAFLVVGNFPVSGAAQPVGVPGVAS